MAVEIEAALFDVDGTLLDTKQFIFHSFDFTLQSRKLPVYTDEEYALLMGRDLDECYRVLAPEENAVQLSEIQESKNPSPMPLLITLARFLQSFSDNYNLTVHTTQQKLSQIVSLKPPFYFFVDFQLF